MDREKFIRSLEESGLQSTAHHLRASIVGDQTATAEGLADGLVRERRLTKYQASVLLNESDEPLAFGEYLILDKVGQGGMGVVFKARRSPDSELIALKVLPQRLSHDFDSIRRFTREADLAKRLVHPNIVRSIEFGEVDSRHFLAMEYVDGRDLSTLVRETGALPLLTAFQYLQHAARGLEYAHSQNVIHRDIKPSNMLVHRDGTVKILDMGLARSMLDDDQACSERMATELTMTGTLLGSTGFMAPEQALNSKNADHRSDIYGLGCTFFFMLTGQEIYKGTTFVEKIVAHREQPIPDLDQLREDAPSIVQHILSKSVAKKAEDRYQSTAELQSDVESCLNEFGHMWMLQRYLTEKKGKVGNQHRE